MAGREGPRPGGRSARVQASVHKAVQDLLAKMDRAEITVPLIAIEAGVTPSTIYRRWGDLRELLADVAVERLRPEMQPVDTGNAQRDLQQWAEQYAEEMSSGPGRQMIRDTLASTDGASAQQCCDFTRRQIEVISERAARRGEAFPEVDAVLDHVVAPIIYRILFSSGMEIERVGSLVGELMKAIPPQPASALKSA